MKGYKAFDKDLKCRKYQYKLDQVNVYRRTPVLYEKGFHFCTELQNIVYSYCKPDMRIFEIEADGIIVNSNDGKVSSCSKIRLIREISFDEVVKSITKSELAYKWALYIDHQEILINFVKDNFHAYQWALYIGNRDIMIDRITESRWAYEWTLNIGDGDIMIDRITESRWAYEWARFFGDKNIMIDRITDSHWAYWWARDIGNKDQMIYRINDYRDAKNWIDYWPNDYYFLMPRFIGKF